MRIGLVSYRCENRNVAFNLKQIETAMQRAQGSADFLCFGEAFLQGFDALAWEYEKDRTMALALTSEEIALIRKWTVQYGLSVGLGYIEKDKDRLYSSYVILSEGRVIHNYRRISRGWKEYTRTDRHYCEGTDTGSFCLHGVEMTPALCGDLWDFPERFQTEHLLLWPVYVNYTPEEWKQGAQDEYAAQAALAAEDVLMINSIDRDPVSHGGAFHFRGGQTAAALPFDQEGILMVEIPEAE